MLVALADLGLARHDSSVVLASLRRAHELYSTCHVEVAMLRVGARIAQLSDDGLAQSVVCVLV